MASAKVVTSEDSTDFEQTLNSMLNKGYKIQNSCCNIVSRTRGPPGFTCIHSALLIKDDETLTGDELKITDKLTIDNNKRFEIRKKIHISGQDLYESFPDGSIKWLIGEIVALNEDWILTHPGTIGEEEILETGFTATQKKHIKDLLRFIHYE